MTKRARRHDLAANTVWSAIDELMLVTGSVVGLLILVPRLGVEQYGAYAALFALMGPVTALAQSGVPLAVFDHAVRQGEPVAAVGRSCLRLTAVVSAITVAPVTVVAIVLFDDLALVTVLLLVVAEVVVQSVWVTLTAIVQVAHSYRAGATLRSAAHAVRIGVVVALLALDRVELSWLAVALALTATARTVAVLAWVRRAGMIDTSHTPTGRGRVERRHMRSAVTYATAIGATIVHTDGDKVVLEANGYRSDTGVYAAGQRMVALAMLPLNALASSSHFAVLRTSVRADQRRVALRLSALGAVYAVPVAVLLVVTAPVVPSVLGDDFASSVDVVRMLAPVVVLRGLAVFPSNGLLALGRNATRTGLAVTHAALAVVGYLLIVPTRSWRGAALVTLGSEALLLVSSWVALIGAQRATDRRQAAVAPRTGADTSDLSSPTVAACSVDATDLDVGAGR
jgi:O-antigen/teichoic acid export membrane protein